MPSYTEEDVQNAIAALRNSEYPSISRCAATFNIPRTTLLSRLQKVKTRIQSHEKQQILTSIEEEELAIWISNASKLGVPTPLPLVKILAEEIQSNRFTSRAESEKSYISPRWIDRFRARHPTLETCFTRPIDALRFEGLEYSKVKSYFDGLSDAIQRERYPASAIFNVDETGFSLGSTRKSVVLLDKRYKKHGKQQSGRQEWITAIECISAAGVTLPPTLIFKGQNLNSGWIPDVSPLDWTFSTSNKGWTSDYHAYEWLTTRFEPLTRRNDGKRRLLVIDGHSSHYTTRFLAFCISRKIDLALLPPHTSHITQPLDIACFSPLKTAITSEIDAIFRNSVRRLLRVEWTSAYIRARARCFQPSTIESAFRKSGIYPLDPEIILSTLPIPRETMPLEDENSSLLEEVPRILRERSRDKTPPVLPFEDLVEEVISRGVLSPRSKAFIRELLIFAEERNTEATLLRRELREKDAILNTRKTRKIGKRVAIEGRVILSRASILREVEKAEEATKTKKTKKGRKRKIIVLSSSDSEEENSEDELA
jgi:hypothetical protein